MLSRPVNNLRVSMATINTTYLDNRKLEWVMHEDTVRGPRLVIVLLPGIRLLFEHILCSIFIK